MNTLPLDIILVVLGNLKKYDIINFLLTCRIYCEIEYYINVFDRDILGFVELNSDDSHNFQNNNSKLGLHNVPEFEYLHVVPKYLNINWISLDLLKKYLKTTKTMYILDTDIEQEKTEILFSCKLLYCSTPKQINNIYMFNLEYLILHIGNWNSTICINAPNLKELYIISKENNFDIKINTTKLKTLCIPNLNFSNYFYKNFEQIENLIIYNKLTDKIDEEKIQNLYITCNQVDVKLLPSDTVKIFIEYYVLLENEKLCYDMSHVFIGNYTTEYVNLKKKIYRLEDILLFYYPNNAFINYSTNYNNSLLTIGKNESVTIYLTMSRTSKIKHKINRLSIDIETFKISDVDIDELTLFSCRATNIYINNCNINRISFEGNSQEYECNDSCCMNIIISNCKIETVEYTSRGTITITDTKIDNLYIFNVKMKIKNRYVSEFKYENTAYPSR